MSLIYVATLLSKSNVNVAETRVRRGNVLVEYVDKRYSSCRQFTLLEAGEEA